MTKITKSILDEHRVRESGVFLIKVDANHSITDTELDGEDIEEIEEKEGVYYAILRAPNRTEKAFAMNSRDVVKVGEMLLKNCWLTGDEEIRAKENEDTLGFSACMAANSIMDINRSAVKKLLRTVLV
jgi:hypothetical protein